MSAAPVFSAASIAGCIFTVLVSIALPVAALAVLKRKTGRGLLAALVGAGCFIGYALVLEQLLHAAVFSLFPAITLYPAAYTAYGCLAAGLFEETGRLMGLSLLCKKDRDLALGVGYGIGHGGIEAILLAGTTSLSNAIVLSAASAGSLEAMFGSDIAATVSAQLASGVSAGALLLPGLERVAAITLHLALSILVWMAVTGRLPKACLALSICLHAAANVGAALYQCGIFSILLAEVWTFAFVLAISLCVWYLYKKSAPRQTA